MFPGVVQVLRSLVIGIMFLASVAFGATAHAASDMRVIRLDATGFHQVRLAQDSAQQQGSSRQESTWQAAKAARACASGGTVLRVDPNGRGYDVRILVASQVLVVRVDDNGRCR
jgi:hypothetical protein